MEVKEIPYKIVRTDSGEYVRYNPEINMYEYVQNEEVISPASNTDILNKNKWEKRQTLLFIEICNKYKDQLNSPKYKKTEMYKLIAQEMCEQNYLVTHEQCVNKMKTLLHKYREIKDHNNTTGKNPKYWEFYEAVEGYLGENRPNVTPKSACSSSSVKHMLNEHNTSSLGTNLPATNELNYNLGSFEGESSASTSSMDETPCKKKRKLSQRVTARKDVAKWLNEYKKEQEQRHQQLLEQSATQHTENKQLVSDLLKLLKDQNKK